MPNNSNLRASLEVLREHIRRYQSGALSHEEFRRLRVVHGLYEQRQAGTYMLRVRVPAGVITVEQAEGLARIAAAAGVARLHLTTRQDIQVHDLKLEASIELAYRLLDVGLHTYGSGGNTVRNIVADPLSGLTADGVFDVLPDVLALDAQYFLSGGSLNLPRKFKIAVSASGTDRAGANAADLGFIATRAVAQRAYRVVVAGGLGQSATTGVELFGALPAEELGLLTDSLLRLFAEEAERSRRQRPRLRHLRQHLGDERFLELCLSYARSAGVTVTAESLPRLPQPSSLPGAPEVAVRDGARQEIIAQTELGLSCVLLRPNHGDIAPRTLTELCGVVRAVGASAVRIGVEQDLWIVGVTVDAVTPMLTRLRGLGLGAPGERHAAIVACSGATTCRLGLLRSRDAADAIEAGFNLARQRWSSGAIRISGCANACSRHLVAALGLEGRVRRVGGRRLPTYAIYWDGGLKGTVAKLGTYLGSIPAKRLPDFVAAVSKVDGFDSGPSPVTEPQVRAVVEEFSKLPENLPESWFCDWGSELAFDQATRRDPPVDLVADLHEAPEPHGRPETSC